MAPHGKYRSRCLESLDNCLLWLMFPCSALVDRLKSTFRLTTEEESDRVQAPCYERCCLLTLLVPALLLCIVLTCPLACLAFLCWGPLQAQRRSYCLQENYLEDLGTPNAAMDTRMKTLQGQETCSVDVPEATATAAAAAAAAASGSTTAGGKDGVTVAEGSAAASPSEQTLFTFASVDTTLLPESLSRLQNLAGTQERARGISARLAGVACRRFSENSVLLSCRYTTQKYTSMRLESQAAATGHPNIAVIAAHVLASIPTNTSVLCLHSVRDWRAEHTLVSALKLAYRFVLHGASDNSCMASKCDLPPGLVVASQLPIEDASFTSIPPEVSGASNGAANGLLSVLVKISSQSHGLISMISFHPNTGLKTDALRPAISLLLNDLESEHKSRNLTFHLLSSNIGDQLRDYSQDSSLSGFEDCIKWAKINLGTDLVLRRLHRLEMATPAELKRTILDVREKYLPDGQRTNRVLAKFLKDTKPTDVRTYEVATVLAPFTRYLPVVVTFTVNNQVTDA